MSNDDKKKEEKSKPVLRFDNEDWVIPASRDEIKKHQSKAFSKKHKKDDKKDQSFALAIIAMNFC